MKLTKNIEAGADSLRKGQRISTVSTIVLILLMVLYLAVTIASSAALEEQTDISLNNPFEVVEAAGDMKMYISGMSLRTERLVRHHNMVDVEHAEIALKELYILLKQPLSKLEDRYMGDGNDAEELKKILILLQTEQEAYLDYASARGAEEAELEVYQSGHLQPLYEQAMDEAEKIILGAQRTKTAYGEKSETLRQFTLRASIVMMVLIVGVLLISQHMLRRQRKELVYRNRLFDDLSLSIDDTFVICDSGTGAISYCALNMKRVLGEFVTDAKEAYQGLKPEDAEEISRAVENPERFPSFEKLVEYTKPTGEKRWLLVRVYRTKNTDTPQIITIFSDRTEEVRSRKALQDAMQTAERANTAKSDFLSRMSHEIRTPLNAIIGMAAIALSSIRNPDRTEDCLNKISLSSKHLLMLVNDILDMSKIESNKMVLQKVPFDIFQVINGYVSTVYAQAKGKKIEFHEIMEGFEEQSVYVGDSLRLNQILLNLSSNAVKFTEPGGNICLNISRITAKSTVDILHFTLSDTGIGMTTDTIERIFKPFEQADASISKCYGGTGLGMSITKNLVTMMNGQIRIKSETGRGTTCMIELPFQRGQDSVEEPDFTDYGLRALIVNVEQQVCQQTSYLLEKLKIRADWELSGVSAVARIRKAHQDKWSYDLCLIDWKMPGMDTIEIVRYIYREFGEKVPVIMVSAYDISEIEQEARDAGVNGFLSKPLYRSAVYAAVKEALDSRYNMTAVHEERNGKLAGKRLLIAEDNALNQEIAVELLTMNGAKVQCANDGKKALELFLASAPGDYDAIMMDVQMPVMDGHEAAKRIRASNHPMASAIPIIATTANAFQDDISAALASGMNAHVSKPLDMNRLCKVLAEYIQKAEA